jgi:hypothetical protein
MTKQSQHGTVREENMDGSQRTLAERFSRYKASKAVLFWACAATAVATIVIGFAWGGWTTGGTAQTMADEAAAKARQQMAAVVCVDRFMAASDAGLQLAQLKSIEGVSARGKFIEDSGWASILPDGAVSDDRRAAALCADALFSRDVAAETAPAAEPATIAQ